MATSKSLTTLLNTRRLVCSRTLAKRLHCLFVLVQLEAKKEVRILHGIRVDSL